jgi:serine kinase of HPr protein (carbohydrate metabolism regulator)
MGFKYADFERVVMNNPVYEHPTDARNIAVQIKSGHYYVSAEFLREHQIYGGLLALSGIGAFLFGYLGTRKSSH